MIGPSVKKAMWGVFALTVVLTPIAACGDDDDISKSESETFEEDYDTSPTTEYQNNIVETEIVEFSDGMTVHCAYVFDAGLWCG